MKKIILSVLAGSLMLGTSVFAAAITTSTSLNAITTVTIGLSNGVIGYYVPDTATNNGAYIITTGHARGDKVYGTGSFSTEIYYKSGTSGNIVSTDVQISTFASNAFATGWEKN